MKMVSVIGSLALLLCIGAVVCQKHSLNDSMIDSMIEELKPAPFPFGRCQNQTSNWSWINVPAPPTPNSFTFYWGCQVRKPGLSRCVGGCPSGEYLIPSRPETRPHIFKQYCQCCRSVQWQQIKPKPKCLIITVVNGNVSWEHDYVDVELEDHKYVTISKCSCQTCGRRLNQNEKEEYVTEKLNNMTQGIEEEILEK